MTKKLTVLTWGETVDRTDVAERYMLEAEVIPEIERLTREKHEQAEQNSDIAAGLAQERDRMRAALERIGNPDFIYSSDDDEDTQLSLRVADARAALSGKHSAPEPRADVLDTVRNTIRCRAAYVDDETVLINLAECLQMTLPSRYDSKSGAEP